MECMAEQQNRGDQMRHTLRFNIHAMQANTRAHGTPANSRSNAPAQQGLAAQCDGAIAPAHCLQGAQEALTLLRDHWP